jgi:beta-lactamase superfamily II metal-dependent hydrolase
MGIVHFLNVKDGDCVWIKHPSGNNTVIDVSNAAEIQKKVSMSFTEGLSGNHNQKNYPVNPIEYFNKYRMTSIFRFILTHPDMDHMDGIKVLFSSYKVINFWDTKNKRIMDDNTDWGAYKKEDWDFYQKIRHNESDPKVLHLYSGSRGKYYNQSEDGTSGADGLYVLAPTQDLVSEANKSDNYNDCSYVILYLAGNSKKLLFAGDSSQETWDYILENHKKDVKNVDILVAPHHGRKTGGNDDYLDVLKPKLTLFGNAKNEHLDYSSWNNRNLDHITNNQANCIILDTSNGDINVYVTYH